MNPNIERLKLIFIAAFAVLTVGAIVWHFGWVVPQRKCESAHKWWDPGERICAQPVLISDVTGRVITDEKALAEAKAALGRGPAPKAAQAAPAPVREPQPKP